jgi:GT2 family glycosyltransferase
MNPVLMVCRNALELTKRAVESVAAQDIPVDLYVIDNDSSDGTPMFLVERRIKAWGMHPAKGVSASWNFGLSYLFDTAMCEHVLVINNDLFLRSDNYRELLLDDHYFVTGVSVDKMEDLHQTFVKSVRPHPDFSNFVIHKRVWKEVGPFDESMVHYASDADYHLRMHQAGIPAVTIGLPFYHYASGTLKMATAQERQAIERQADRDRDTFEKKWGVKVGSEAYYELFNGKAPQSL